MKRLKIFWDNPSHRWSINFISLIFLSVLCTISFLFKVTINTWFTLIVWILIFFLVLVGLINLLSINSKKIIIYLFYFLKWDKNKYIYQFYKNKEYRGPNWNDDQFKSIDNLKKRIDIFSQATIIYQENDFSQWKKYNINENLASARQTFFRSLWIVIAGTISISILAYFGWFEYLSASRLITINDISRGFFTIPVALLGTIVATPVIFIVWLFRDKNNRVQIENARKDINLKDFQKLSEWASGFHLPEIKQTVTTKVIDKVIDDNKVESITERFTGKEEFLKPDGSSGISHRQGAEALQASAIAQLESFMFGKYGEQFMQPAFLLIHAIWESIISQQIIENNEYHNLKKIHQNQIISALNKALTGKNGYHLRLFVGSLPRLNLIGLSTTNPLYLAGCNLQQIQLSNAFLSLNALEVNLEFTDLTNSTIINSNLQKSQLNSAKLIKSNLKEIEAQFANLMNANLSRSKISRVSFNGANLNLSDFKDSIIEYSDFSNTYSKDIDLKNSNLNNVNFEGADLSFAQLQGAELKNTPLDRAIVTNLNINRHTKFKLDWHNLDEDAIREDLLARGAFWGDNPEWLNGRIKDNSLMKMILTKSNSYLENV
ncbi:pentapeptide repeat-containing protein [Acinetobacter haemolyticus]|nr:pentapeptide repeat-containing protein [Acinetobacter haemolyticus]